MSRSRKFLVSRFGPFQRPDFRRFFMVQSASLIGNWMQDLAKSWIILSIYGKASAIGSLLFASALPNLLLGTFGGVWADQKKIRPILIITQIALATLAFSLGILVSGGLIQYWHLMVFAAMEGTIIAFDLPAFNKITPSLVPREELQQALALNSVNFHLSRVLGPTLAGIAMGFWGPASVFWINSASFAGVVIILISLKSLDQISVAPRRDSGMGIAWKYLWNHPTLWRVVVQLGLIICLVFPLIFTTLRVYLKQRFNLDSHEFGFVFAVPGIGSLAGSLTFLLWSPKNPLKVLPVGLTGVVGFLLVIAEADTLLLALIATGLFAFNMFLTLGALTVSIQLRTSNEMRGRISAIVGMFFVSLAPIMGLPIGLISDLVGERVLIWSIASIVALGSTVLYIYDKYGRNRGEEK